MEKKQNSNDTIYNVIRIDKRLIYDLFYKQFDNRLYYSIEEIELERICPTSLYIQSERLKYAEFTARTLIQNGLQLYEPHIKVDSTGTKRFVPPPIIEIRRELCVLCDGTHRIFTAKRIGINRIVVMIVRGTYKPLAGDITSWDIIQINDNKYKISENFVNYNSEGMTGYSKFCKSDHMVLGS